MFQSFVSWVQSLSEYAIVNPWLVTVVLISIQLVLLSLMAVLLSRQISFKQPSVAHRIYLGTIALALALLPIHGVSGGWSLPLARSIDRTNAQPDQQAQSDDTPAPIRDVGPVEVISSTIKSTAVNVDESLEVADSARILHTMESDTLQLQASTGDTNWYGGIIAWFGSLFNVLLSIYLIGAIVCASRYAFGYSRLLAIKRRAVPLVGDRAELIQRAVDQLSLKRTPDVRVCDGVSIPMVMGFVRPTVLLPGSFPHWSDDECWATLIHELTHIKRLDMLGQLLAVVLRIVYWFHPVSRFLDRKLAEAREWATDQQVIQSGIDASRYAACLLEIVARSSRTSLLPERVRRLVIPMCAEKLEERLRRTLQVSTDNQRSKSWALPVSLLAMLAVVALTTVRLGRAEAQEQKNYADTSNTASANTDASPNVRDESSIVNRCWDADVVKLTGDAFAKVLTIRGKVINADGSPASGATVLLRESCISRNTIEHRKARPLVGTNINPPPEDKFCEILAKVKADSEGRYEFVDVKAPAYPEDYRNSWSGDVVAMHPEHGIGVYALSRSEEFRPQVSNAIIQLRPTGTISGVVKSPTGTPLPNAKVRIASIEEPKDGLSRMIEGMELWGGQLEPHTTTDQEGRFEFSGVPAGYVANILVQHPEWLFRNLRVATDPSVPLGVHDFLGGKSVVHAPPVEFIGSEGVVLTGFVQDAAGLPLSGAQVSVGSFATILLTDERGGFRFRMPNPSTQSVPGDSTSHYAVRIFPPRDVRYLPYSENVRFEDFLQRKVMRVRLEPGAMVRGTVVSEEGVGVPNVSVRIAGEEIYMNGITDQEGRYQMVLPKAEHVLVFGTSSPGWLMPGTSELYQVKDPNKIESIPHLKVNLLEGKDTELPPLRVSRTPSIRVAAILPDGRRAAGGTAIIKDIISDRPLGKGFPSMARDVERSASQELKQNGIADLTPQGTLSENAKVEVTYTDATRKYFGSELCKNLTEGEVWVKLEPSWIVTGRVLLDGQPVSGAEVAVATTVETRTGGPGVISRYIQQDHLVTNEEGRYTTQVIRGYQYTSTIQRLPNVPNIRTGQSLASTTPIGNDQLAFPDCNFSRGTESIEGRIVDEAGKPVKGVGVSIREGLGVSTYRWIGYSESSQLVTDDEGFFALRKMPAGEYVLQMSELGKETRFNSTVVTTSTGVKDLVVLLTQRATNPPRLVPQSIEKITPAAGESK